MRATYLAALVEQADWTEVQCPVLLKIPGQRRIEPQLYGSGVTPRKSLVESSSSFESPRIEHGQCCVGSGSLAASSAATAAATMREPFSVNSSESKALALAWFTAMSGVLMVLTEVVGA